MNDSFIFNNKQYQYHTQSKVERIVELPIIFDYVQQFKDKKILEIGNVLSNYYTITHDVLDKYDISSRCIKHDIVSYLTSIKYDLIVSISTLEHVGYEAPEIKDPSKIKRSIENIKDNLLANSGMCVITIPLGWNKILDAQIDKKEIIFDEIYFMKRIEEYKWIQDNDTTILGDFYDNPWGCGNKLLIGILKKEI